MSSPAAQGLSGYRDLESFLREHNMSPDAVKEALIEVKRIHEAGGHVGPAVQVARNELARLLLHTANEIPKSATPRAGPSS